MCRRMVQASLFAVVPLVVVSLVVAPLVVAPLGAAATGFAIWLEPFVEVQENKDENIVLYLWIRIQYTVGYTIFIFMGSEYKNENFIVIVNVQTK
jgi:hypothetical protein